MTVKTTSLRMPQRLADEADEAAARMGGSTNRFLVEAIQEKLVRVRCADHEELLAAHPDLRGALDAQDRRRQARLEQSGRGAA